MSDVTDLIEGTPVPTAVGRAFTVAFVDDKCIPVLVTVTRKMSARGRLRFSGNVLPDRNLVGHLQSTVLAILDRVLSHLLVHPPRPGLLCELLVAREVVPHPPKKLITHDPAIGAAVLLSSFSAVLDMLVRQDLGVWAAVVSPEGHFGPASHASERREIALEGHNTAVIAACPAEHHTETAAPQSSPGIMLATIRHLGDLVRIAVDDRAILESAIRTGFRSISASSSATPSGIWDTVCYFAARNDERFIAVLAGLVAEQSDGAAARDLVSGWLGYHARVNRYPAGVGQSMLHLLQSAPREQLAKPGVFPLAPPTVLLELLRRTDPVPIMDFYCLVDAVRGPFHPATVARPPETSAQRAAAELVNHVVRQLSKAALAEVIDIPLSTARASWVVRSTTEPDPVIAMSEVDQFYACLLQAMGNPVASADEPVVQGEAHALLNRAFAGDGGVEAAVAEMRDGLRGGIQYVLDRLAAHYQREQITKYTQRIIHQAIPQEWSVRVSLAQYILELLGPVLPERVRQQPPEAWAASCDTLLSAYVLGMMSFEYTV